MNISKFIFYNFITLNIFMDIILALCTNNYRCYLPCILHNAEIIITDLGMYYFYIFIPCTSQSATGSPTFQYKEYEFPLRNTN